jgi:hypothetical protein
MKNAPLLESWGLGTALVLEQEVVRLFLFFHALFLFAFFLVFWVYFQRGKG